MDRRSVAIGVWVIAFAVACGPKPQQQPATEPPVVEQRGAPPEDLTDEQREAWRQKLEAQAIERANRPPPKVAIEWPPAIDTDLVAFTGWWIRLEARVDFDPGQTDVAPEAKDVLDDLVFILRETPRIQKIEIQSHLHPQFETYGVEVSQQRANAIKVYLVSQGIAPERIDPKGYGDTMPIETNTTEEGRHANERIEIIVRQIDEHPVNEDQ